MFNKFFTKFYTKILFDTIQLHPPSFLLKLSKPQFRESQIAGKTRIPELHRACP